MSPDPNCRRLLSHRLEFRIRCAGPAGAYLNKQTTRGMNSSDLCLHGRNSSQNSQAHLSFVCLVIWKWDNLSCHCSTCHLLFAIFPKWPTYGWSMAIHKLLNSHVELCNATGEVSDIELRVFVPRVDTKPRHRWRHSSKVNVDTFSPVASFSTLQPP